MTMRMKNVKLVAFDLDGVIADTEPLHKQSKLDILAGLGIRGDGDMERYVGKPNAVYWTEMREKYGISQSLAELERMQYDGIVGLLAAREMMMSEGLAELLNVLSSRNIATAVCSSSDRRYVDQVLRFFRLDSHFSPVVGGDEVAARKPSPDGYLKVLKVAETDAENAVAIEDSTAGIAAAKAAGMRVVGYRNHTSGNQDLSAADAIVDELEDVLGIIE